MTKNEWEREIKYDEMQEARADEEYEMDMRDFEKFIESEPVQELAQAIELVKKLCDDYGHDFYEVRSYL